MRASIPLHDYFYIHIRSSQENLFYRLKDLSGVNVKKREGVINQEDKKRINVNFNYGGGEEVVR
jgi:hypothetical protein